MKSKYLVDTTTFELPDFDKSLSEYIRLHETYWGSVTYIIGIMHNGVLYRCIICDDGLGEFVGCCEWLNKQGYTNLLPGKPKNGYDAIFVADCKLSPN